MRNDIVIYPENPELMPIATRWAEQLRLPIAQDGVGGIVLRVSEAGLELMLSEQPKLTPLRVDFVTGAARHRRLYGGGRGQLIAKAVGLNKMKAPRVLDVTAGLGRDAFVLACLGCSVTMVERSKIIGALLEDGVDRLAQDTEMGDLSLSLIQQDAIEYLQSLSSNNYPDVIYLDPMFPERTKSAQVKKEMIMLRAVVGDDLDAQKLWQCALGVAKKRVVVKRAKLAPPFEGREPSVVYQGKSSRYDVYINPLLV